MNKEILMVVDVVCNEKGVAKDIIFEAIELALASATKKRNREDIESRVSIDRETGDYDTFRCWEVVDDEVWIAMANIDIDTITAQSLHFMIDSSGYYVAWR